MEELNVLREFGLSEKEAKVYLTLLKEGSTTVTPLFKKTQLQRGSLYDILDRLIEKGLVTYVIKSNRKHFEALDPKTFLQILEDKKEQINEILPKLMSYQKSEEAKVTVYKGRKGMQSVYRDYVRAAPKTCYVFGASGSKFKEAIGEHFFIQFERQIQEYGGIVRIIFNEEARGLPILDEIANPDFKFISDEFGSPSHTMIYDDKVVIHILEGVPIIILIQSKEVAQSYLNFFNHLWKIAKP
jgi:HTH-type transcriptional regulator, sugar sensing transcriptional regulator